MTEAPYAVRIPQETVNDESVRIIAWKAASGILVVKEQLICEIETSKVVVEMHAPVSGLLDYRFSAGDDVAVGATLFSIIPNSTALTNGSSNVAHRFLPPDASAPANPPMANGSSPTIANGSPSAIGNGLPPARMTPSARKTAVEYHIDASAFAPGSLVRRNDVLRLVGIGVEDGTASPVTPQEKRRQPDRSMPAGPSATAGAVGVAVEWRTLARKKVVEGKILAAGKSAVVQSSVTTRVNAPFLRTRMRKLYSSDVAFDSLVLFETSRLLLRYAELNALHHGGRIGVYRAINIGWAIDSGSNLVAPVVRACDRKTLSEIVIEMESQLERFLNNQLSLEELTGGTFTMSDLSTDGVCFFHPLVSGGQSAILGISGDRNPSGDEVIYLTLSFDHQLTEGRMAARFLQELASRLEAHSIVESLATVPPSAKSPAAPAFCVLCQRDYALLMKSRAVLLKSEYPPGLVCSLCVGGF